jgi:hypothetical protein
VILADEPGTIDVRDQCCVGKLAVFKDLVLGAEAHRLLVVRADDTRPAK